MCGFSSACTLALPMTRPTSPQVNESRCPHRGLPGNRHRKKLGVDEPAVVFADSGTGLRNKKEGTVGLHVHASEPQGHRVERKIQTHARTFCETPLTSRPRADSTDAQGQKSGKGLTERTPGRFLGCWAWLLSDPARGHIEGMSAVLGVWDTVCRLQPVCVHIYIRGKY